MPLDRKLKSDMTGEPMDAEPAAGETPEPAAAPAAEPVPIPAESKPAAPEAEPQNEKPAAAPAQTQAVPADYAATLHKIERQLQMINENMADLENALNLCQSPNFAPVFAKIEAAQTSVEKLLASTCRPAAPDTALTDKIDRLEAMLQAMTEKQDKVDRQLVQSLRENATFQVQVRQGLQKDVETLRKEQSGEQYNNILKELANMYSDYQMLLDEENLPPKTRKNLLALFETLEDLMLDYDAEVVRCQVGDVRPTRQCKIINKIPTGDEEKHNTIALSRKPGVMRGKLVLCHEFVDVYVYDPSLKPAQPEEPAEPEIPTAAEDPAPAAETEAQPPVAETETPCNETTNEEK